MDPCLQVESFILELNHYISECLLQTWATDCVLIEETLTSSSVSFASSLTLIPLLTGGKTHSKEKYRE